MNNEILDQRIKAWIYMGVEQELELVDLCIQSKNIEDNTPDKKWIKEKIEIAQAKLELCNDRFKTLETQRYPFQAIANYYDRPNKQLREN